MPAANKQPAEILTSLYLRILTRSPSETGKKKLLAAINEGKTPNEQKEILEDIFWALLNSKEFIFNH
jgi:hypothetical protein